MPSRRMNWSSWTTSAVDIGVPGFAPSQGNPLCKLITPWFSPTPAWVFRNEACGKWLPGLRLFGSFPKTLVPVLGGMVYGGSAQIISELALFRAASVLASVMLRPKCWGDER
jgi:hypothetical protein